MKTEGKGLRDVALEFGFWNEAAVLEKGCTEIIAVSEGETITAVVKEDLPRVADEFLVLL